MILGTGIDIVDLEAFAGQVDDAASTFVAQTFTAGERRDARGRASGDPVRHLGARFAAKEALIKAWSAQRFGCAPTAQSVDLREIEVVTDAWGRPALRLHGAVASAVAALSQTPTSLHLSMSHDGRFACASVVIEALS